MATKKADAKTLKNDTMKRGLSKAKESGKAVRTWKRRKCSFQRGNKTGKRRGPTRAGSEAREALRSRARLEWKVFRCKAYSGEITVKTRDEADVFLGKPEPPDTYSTRDRKFEKTNKRRR